MSKPSPAQAERAKRLLAAEGNSGSNADECAAAAWRVYEKLNDRLAPLIGAAGVLALFARSAKLAQAEFSSLAVVAAPDGSTKLGTSLQALEPAIATEAAATLFGIFLDLVMTFIGQRLAILALQGAWPEIE